MTIHERKRELWLAFYGIFLAFFIQVLYDSFDFLGGLWKTIIGVAIAVIGISLVAVYAFNGYSWQKVTATVIQTTPTTEFSNERVKALIDCCNVKPTFDKDVELLKVSITKDNFQTYFNLGGSILAGGLVSLVVLILTLYYNQPFLSIVMIIVESAVFIAAFLWNNNRNNKFLDICDKWMAKIAKEETLPSLSDMKKWKVD